MKLSKMWIAASFTACLASGFVGACLAFYFLADRAPGALRVTRLDLVDTNRRVRAVLSSEDGSVSLRMLSGRAKPVLELGVRNESRPQLVMYSETGTPNITLTTQEKDRGILAFSSENTPSQVTVGYSPVGDFEDGHDRGAWGLQIGGPEHTHRDLLVFGKDGKLTGFTLPLETPRVFPAK
jgi:hypothetical protein